MTEAIHSPKRRPWVASSGFALLAMTVLLFFPASVRAQDITTGLVGHWKLDETSGAAIDDSGSGDNDGTWVDGVNNTVDPAESLVGKDGMALQFDDDGVYVDAGVSNILTGQQSFTLAAWVKFDVVTGQATRILGRYGNYDLIHTDTGYWFFTFSDGSTYPSLSVSSGAVAGTWYHVVGVHDTTANTLVLYVNGEEVASDTGVTQALVEDLPSETATIGRNTDIPGPAHAVDDARIYNRALSAADVAALYNATNPVCSSPAGLLSDIVFNTTADQLQYCASTGWVGMGKASAVPLCNAQAAGAISAAPFLTCAVYSDDEGYCWGNAADNALGNNSTSPDQSSPVNVEDGTGPGTYTMISAGEDHACGLSTNGAAYCWGSGWAGQIGDNAWSTRATPRLVANGASPGTFKQIDVGSFNSCAIGTDDNAYCWGRESSSGTSSMLGDNDPDSTDSLNKNTPVAVLDGDNTSGTFKQISIGTYRACAIGGDDRAYCWGPTFLGYVPTLVPDGAGPGTYVSITTGDQHTCALAADGQAYCWGTGGNGQLGNGSSSTSGTPVRVSNGASPGTFTSISAGSFHTCAIGTDGHGYCWGLQQYGRLGNNVTTNTVVNTPQLVVNGASNGYFTSITAGDEHSCGIGTDYKMYCWGAAADGKVGNGVTTGSYGTPVAVGSGASNGLACVAGSEDTTTGLVGHWTLDETSGTSAADSSGNGNTGTLTNGPTWATGQVGTSAVSFDGADDYITFPDSSSLDITGNGTLTAWVKRSSTGTWDAIINKESWGPDTHNYNLEISDTGALECEISDGVIAEGIYSAVVLNDTSFHHVACTWDGTSIRVYVDAVLIGTVAQTITPVATTDPVSIGKWQTADYMNGIIDDVRIYNRALTAEQVAALYVGGITTPLGCSSPTGTAGDLVYNSTTSQMQYCNGAEWIAMGPPGNGGGGCTNPTGAAGDMVFNSALDAMQYCEGDAWVGIGKGVASGAPTAGLIHHWKMEDADNAPLVDDVGSADCTLLGSTVSIPGQDGNAINIGTGANCGDIADIKNLSAVTISGWFQRTGPGESTGAGKEEVDGAGLLGIYVWNDANTYFSNTGNNTTYSEQGLIADNDRLDMRHVTMVFDGTQTGNANRLKGYVNGAPVTLTYLGTIPATTSAVARDFIIGTFGNVDDVRIYNRALSDQEVQDLYSATDNDACTAGGTSVGGSCWYFGVLGASCTDMCTDVGLTYSTATETYAGSSGSNANCTAVLDAVFPYFTPAVNDIVCGVGNGCIITDVPERERCTSPATNAGASSGDTWRACACQ